MRKNILMTILICAVALLCLCGCAKKCANCNTEIAEGSEIQIGDDYYCENCVEYCDDCNTAFVKDSGELLIYKEKKLCQDCFDKAAYPITLEDNDKVTVEIVGYNDSEGTFTIKVTNKTDYQISTYQEGESALLDGKDKCVPETDGTWSFAYADVPANEDVTVFSTFRKSEDDWDTILKMSDKHSFEFVMKAWISDDSYDDFWETSFKVSLTPDMFGYGE